MNAYNLRSQIETSSSGGWGGSRYLPCVFTEQGVAMLSGIINSDKAIQMNIAIMRAFVELRKILLLKSDFRQELDLNNIPIVLHCRMINAYCFF